MICLDCRTAADMNIPLRHKDCPGSTWCDCQHRKGPAVEIREAENNYFELLEENRQAGK